MKLMRLPLLSPSTAFLVAAILLFAALVALTIAKGGAQTLPSPSYQVPVWNPASGKSGAYGYPTLGPHLTVTNGVLDAVIPAPAATAPPATQTKRDVLLTFDASKGGWTAPDAAIGNVAVYVNGLRYHQGTDFSLSGNVIVPIATGGAFDAAYLVTADYDVK